MKRFTVCWVAALFILATSALAKANALPATVAVRLTQYHVKPSFREKFRQALSSYISSSLKAAGNIMAEAYYEETAPSILWLIERWSDRSFLDKNDGSPAAKNIMALTKDGLESPADVFFVQDLEPLPKAAYRKMPRAGDHPLTIMLFVDAKEGTEDNFKSLYHTAMPAFRNEPGVIAYQLSQVSADKTKFITYEKFRSQEAFQAHLKIPAVEPVIQYLRTSIKAPPFEKGLHRLVGFAPTNNF